MFCRAMGLPVAPSPSYVVLVLFAASTGMAGLLASLHILQSQELTQFLGPRYEPGIALNTQ